MNKKGWSIRGFRMLFSLVLVVAYTLGSMQFALADTGGVKGHTFDVTFTKWVTIYPHMIGVVGDDVGHGSFAGEILSYVDDTVTTKIEALYHMNGSRHSFTADVHVTQSDATGMAVITGRVTKGWLKGMSVTGEYKTLKTCDIPTPGNSNGNVCFQGTLHIHRGPGE